MFKKIILIIFYAFFLCSFRISTDIVSIDPGSKEQVIDVNKGSHTHDKKNSEDKLSKITTLLSVCIIGIFSLLTLALLKNINYRAKANKLLQQKNKELSEEKEKAEKANKAKAEFLSTVTHELRTPLYAVTGITHLLLNDNPKPEQKEHLNSLRFSGEYLLSLINNILDFNKLEAEKVEIEYSVFNLKKRISDVMIALEKESISKKNTLNLEFDKRIPNKIEGDSLKISQILINLIGNAIKFTSDGQINIRVQKLESDKENIRLLFEIEDNGLGISEEQQKNIFKSFSQESVVINRKYGGTGLGLAIVKKLLKLLGSEINLESVKDKGSKFFFEIDFKTHEEEVRSEKKRKLDRINFEILKDKSILVVEDNKINQMITCKTLNKYGVKTEVAVNGEIAVEKCKQNNYDLILMDIHMPGISGFEASAQIREFDVQTPIIALTAVTLSKNNEEFYSNGINDIIPKPYEIEDFFGKIETAILQNIS